MLETVSEIPVVHVHVPPASRDETFGSEFPGVSAGPWSPGEIPRRRRPSPTTIAIVAAIAGVGAMALGTAAVLSAGRASSERTATVVAASAGPTVPADERAALALLAKPSTQRVAFANSGGRVLLAVGSGGRAAILIRGLERAAPGRPYYAWALAPGTRPVRAARFVGTERAVLLSTRLGHKTSVAIAAGRPGSHYSGHARIVAARS